MGRQLCAVHTLPAMCDCVSLQKCTKHDCDATKALRSIKVRQRVAQGARAALYISFALLSSTPQDNERISNYTLNQASMATQHESAIWG